MELGKGVHHFATVPFNWYVIEEAGRLTLVDAGFPGHFRVFEEGLRSMGREPKDVEAVIITHAHADHMGFAERVARLANAPVYVHAADVPRARSFLQLPWMALFSNAWRPFMAATLGRAVANGVFSAARIGRPRALRDGDVLDVPGRPQVIHTPGHTPGHVALFMPTQRVLLSGDALVTQDLYTGHAGLQLTRRRLNTNFSQAQASLKRLEGLGQVTLLPGHGQPWTGEMREAVAAAQEHSDGW